MKRIALYSILCLGIVFSACRKDEEDNGPAALSGLAAFMNGEFEVTQVDYNGSIQTQISNIPLAGTGTNTQGSYLFDSRAKTADYNVRSNIEINFLGQNIPLPIVVDGNGPVTFNSETQFQIDDPRYGLMTYNISNKTNTSMIATTRFRNDTTIGTVDVLMDVYMEKK